MKPAQLRIFQALADLAIPLTGYFFLDWSFYFILLFFVLDHIVSSVFTFVRVNKVNSYRGVRGSFPLKNALLTIVCIAVAFIAVIPAIQRIDPRFDLAKETWHFIIYTEPGFPVPQGIILIPLLVFGGYQQYKMQFLITGKFTAATPEEIWKMHFTTVYLVLGISALFLGLSQLIVFPWIVYTLILIFGVAAYRFLYARQ